MARVLLAESFSTPDLARNAFGDAMKKGQPLARWIKEASDDGRLAVGDPELATMQLMSLLKGLLFWPLVIGYGERPGKKQESDIVDGALRMFLDHYEQ
jgi:TetR/AcrR family transcriptional regulator of autoinduction and epiphytic fitness